jgi:copper chaperone CopZ
MKTFFLLAAIAFSMSASAQVTKVSLQASGLTCSMCSNSINRALKKLDFVDKIDSDIKTYTFEITFKPKANVDFDMIKTKVEGAGFSVSGFIVTVNFNKVLVKENQPVLIGDKTFLFVNKNEQLLDGEKQVRLLDKGFVSAREYKSNSYSILPLTYHAAI